jgi:hypothetical protein
MTTVKKSLRVYADTSVFGDASTTNAREVVTP